MKHKIAVIIPVYNAEAFVEQTLQSVLAQTYKDFQIVIVDDGSTDQTTHRIKPYLNEQVTLICQENSWVGKARNVGVEATDADYVAFLDADDLWHPEKLALQLQVFTDHPEVRYVGCNFGRIDGSGGRISVGINPQSADVVRNFRDPLLFSERVSALNSSTLMLRKTDYLKIGGFREDKYMRSLDYDFAIRISALGPGYILGRPLMDYRVLAQSMLHGDPTIEYEAQIKIFNLHRDHYNNKQWKNRLSKTYHEWADTLLFENLPGFKTTIKKSIRLNPWYVHNYVLTMKYLFKSLFKKG